VAATGSSLVTVGGGRKKLVGGEEKGEENLIACSGDPLISGCAVLVGSLFALEPTSRQDAGRRKINPQFFYKGHVLYERLFHDRYEER